MNSKGCFRRSDKIKHMFRVGIDLGGTKIEGVVLDESGRELFRKRIETQQEHGYRHILQRTQTLYLGLVATVLIKGPQAIAGEWGHMSINPDGPLCYCGQRGCVETYISGSGVEARYAERYREKRSFAEIADDYKRREPGAIEAMRAFFRNFGRSLANVIDVLDPDVVVLGGGVSKFDSLYSEGVTEVARFVFSDVLETPIVRHQLGDSAGVIGAALIGI